ncbi:MAG: hypothetical protein HPY71_09425 [Firmicutes bacterium]|nr:hypothetical protein [Bacillota bacterium]
MIRSPYIPPELFFQEDLSLQAKYVYVVISIARPRSLGELVRLTKKSRCAIRRYYRELEQAGWVKTIRQSGRSAIIPTMPKEVEKAYIMRIKHNLDMSGHRAETVMKRFLDFLIPDDNYIDNARPQFLRNPDTGQPLEYDRYYLAGVAFEFNGDQHYGPTEMYPDKQAFKERRKRDLIKLGLSMEKNIKVIVVTRDDLTLKKMISKIPPELPVDPVDPESEIAKLLEEVGRGCMR